MKNTEKHYTTHSNTLDVFGDRLKSALKKKGIKQVELAKQLGYSVQKVSNYANSLNKPDFDFVVNAAKLLGVSVDYLLGISEDDTADLRAKAIADDLGISSKAVEQIRLLTLTEQPSISAFRTAEAFDRLMKHKDFKFLVVLLSNYIFDLNEHDYDEGTQYSFNVWRLQRLFLDIAEDLKKDEQDRPTNDNK